MNTGARSHAVIPSLDGVRALAILAVIVGHAHLTPADPASLGVTVFFFLSGYLITTLLRVEYEKSGSISLRAFYLRRIFRIFPPMYVVLAAAVILSAIGFAGSTLNWWGTLGAATFLSNYMHIWGAQDTLPVGTGIFWSLAVEEHFYIVFPLFYSLLIRATSNRRHHAIVIASLCAAVLAWRCVLLFVLQPDNAEVWLYYGSDTRADSILFGSLLAVWGNPYLDRPAVSRKVALWGFLPGGVVVALGAAALPEAAKLTVGFTLTGIALAFVFIAIVQFSDSWVGRLLNWRALTLVGVLSYGAYLIHRIVQIGIDDYMNLNTYVGFVIGLLLILAIAWVMHLYIEKPAAGLRKRFATTNFTAAHDDGVVTKPDMADESPERTR
jgi:peptidoglycan/LPS O-acetylase OafA/YrhL